MQFSQDEIAIISSALNAASTKFLELSETDGFPSRAGALILSRKCSDLWVKIYDHQKAQKPEAA